MLLNAERARLDLADDEVVRLTDACDSRLRVAHGCVWVTIDGDRGDVILQAGDAFVVGSTDRVTVSALRGPAAVEIQARAGAARCERPAPTRRVRRPSRFEQLLTSISLSSAAVA